MCDPLAPSRSTSARFAVRPDAPVRVRVPKPRPKPAATTTAGGPTPPPAAALAASHPFADTAREAARANGTKLLESARGAAEQVRAKVAQARLSGSEALQWVPFQGDMNSTAGRQAREAELSIRQTAADDMIGRIDRLKTGGAVLTVEDQAELTAAMGGISGSEVASVSAFIRKADEILERQRATQAAR